MQMDFVSTDLTLVVPWSLPDDLLNDMSEPRAQMERIFKDKVGEKLKLLQIYPNFPTENKCAYILVSTCPLASGAV